MTVQNDVNKLYMDTLIKCEIKRVFVNGFDKFIVYNKRGTLFVVGYNKTTNQHGFGRGPLMEQEYKYARLNSKILPDYKALYAYIDKIYEVHKKLPKDIRDIFNFVDDFCRMGR